MRRLTTLLVFLLTTSVATYAQYQNPDPDGEAQANFLKKMEKKARYGAYLIEKEISFGTGKGLNNQPTVTVSEVGNIEMVSLENKVNVGYLLPYNQFVRLNDYDFEIFYRNNFKSQKYPPVKVSLTDDAIFFDDNYGQYYGFQAMQSGQRCRFRYNYVYSDGKYLTRLFFHEGIPIRDEIITFRVPDWLELDITEKNFEGYKISKTVKKDKDVNVITYKINNLPSLHEESASLARPYYLPHLIITLRSFTLGQKKYNVLKNLDDMYAWYDLLYKKADNNTDVLKNQVQQLIQGKTTDEDKIKAIYYWVQDNIRYIAYEEGYAGYVPTTVQEVFKDKYGDCKGMANLLTEMLKLAGFDAHFAWIGTREIPYDRKEIQALCVDNHAISVLYLKGKTYFLDGTEKYASFGRNAYRIQGKSALVEHGDKYSVEVVPPATVDENVINTKATLALNNDKLMGHVTMTFDGETKNFFHNVYNAIPANKRKQFINALLELNNNNTEATNVKTSDFNDRDIPIKLDGDIEISNQVTKADNLCYTGIDFFPATITSFIPDEERKNPIDIDNIFLSTDEVTLELPKGAKAKALPANFQSSFLKNNMSASYTAINNTIVLKKKFELNSPVIRNSEFSDWKAFVNRIKEFNRNNITVQLP
ncbi:MAG: hypothetical protein C5B52_10960 [Bacteroidetes bacterium]|nr:MAG: hypothetical protein C5B52_10960 [Bacteroidota bacterium]